MARRRAAGGSVAEVGAKAVEASSMAAGVEDSSMAAEAQDSSVAAGVEASTAARRTIDSNHLGSDQNRPLERPLWSTGVSHDRQLNPRINPSSDSHRHWQHAARHAFARARRSRRHRDVRGSAARRRAGRLPDARRRRQCVRECARDQRPSRHGKGARQELRALHPDHRHRRGRHLRVPRSMGERPSDRRRPGAPRRPQERASRGGRRRLDTADSHRADGARLAVQHARRHG
ncbi:hypothetical protein BCAR13_1720007 [Paraburkholderia caribensis]|nr:hypothetical protein BCAR13_1720007 [Paraburkholderia caribensis]